MKTEYEQAVEWNCSLSDIEQIALEEKYLPKIERNGEICLDGTKQTKEWYIEVWKKETQEYNETFNPEAHSSLIIDFDKVETIEEAAYDYTESIMFSHKSLDTAIMAKRFDKCYITGAKSDAAKNHWFKIFQEEQKGQDKQQKS